jgi:hypothetical protein
VVLVVSMVVAAMVVVVVAVAVVVVTKIFGIPLHISICAFHYTFQFAFHFTITHHHTFELAFQYNIAHFAVLKIDMYMQSKPNTNMIGDSYLYDILTMMQNKKS